MAKRTKFLLSALTGLVIAGSAAFFYGKSSADKAVAQTEEPETQNGPPPAIVAVSNVETRMLAPLSQAPGSVVSTRDSLVAASTNGKIEWVANVGAEVKTGDVIARIEKADAIFQRDDSRAQMLRLRARADYLDRLLTRFTSLGDDSGESEAGIDEMRSNRDEARQALAQAEVSLERAETNLTRTDVVAPFDGRIVTQEIQVGEFATPGASIARLVDTKNLEVTARAPASLALNIKQGDLVEINNGPDKINASVRAVVPVGDALSRMLEIRFALPQSSWYIGSPVQVRLPTQTPKEALAVHRDALVLRSDGISVFFIGEDNIAKRVLVELGAADGDFIEIIGDIPVNAKVVIRGGERLRDGQSVKIADNSSALAA